MSRGGIIGGAEVRKGTTGLWSVEDAALKSNAGVGVGEILCVGGEAGIEFLAAPTFAALDNPRFGFFGQVVSGARAIWSTDGTKMAILRTTGVTPLIYNTATWKQKPYAFLQQPIGQAACCDFSPDGTYIAIGYNSSPFLRVWNLSTATEIYPTNGPTGSVRDVKFSPDGKILLTINAGAANSVVGYAIPTGARVLFNAAVTGNTCIAFSPDNSRVVVGNYQAANMSVVVFERGTPAWDNTSSARTYAIKNCGMTAVYAASFSPDGSTLAVVGGFSGSYPLVLVNTTTWAATAYRGPLTGNTLSRVAYSPSGTYLAVAGIQNVAVAKTANLNNWTMLDDKRRSFNSYGVSWWNRVLKKAN